MQSSGQKQKNVAQKISTRSMAPRPIAFAMASPDPEIAHEHASVACKDVITATGRSDYPNQVNNVIGFPFISRGAVDVHAAAINGRDETGSDVGAGGFGERRCASRILKNSEIL